MTIPLYDDFDSPQGQFANYDTYTPAQTAQLPLQKHVNIRSFMQKPVTVPLSMFSMRNISQSTLNTYTMSALANATQVQPGESWTVGTVGPIASIGNFNGITLTCTNGLNTTTSVTVPVKISGFTASDYLSLTLPNFPLSRINASQSFIDISSDASGNFAANQTDSLAFSSSTTSLSTTNVEARFPYSALVHSNPAAITAVRFRITATGACTFICLAVRVIATSWTYGLHDINTLYGRLERTVPPTGSAFQPFGLPGGLTTWPTMFFSDGQGGPLVTDSDIGYVISTGAMNATNSFTLYLRSAPFFTETQTQLGTQTMGQLATARQPGTAPATLDDPLNTHAVSVTVSWGTGVTSNVIIQSDTNTGYAFTRIFASNTDYYVRVSLTNTTIRVSIYPISANGLITWSSPLMDQTINDWVLLPRRQGRIGWLASLGDGNAYIHNLRPTKLIYGEYRSAPLYSDTPVTGAQVFASTSGATNLFTGFSAEGAAQLALDTVKSSSGNCIRVNTAGAYAGVQSDPIRFANFEQTVIDFDLFVPTGISIAGLLIGEGRLITLAFPAASANQWTHYTISLESLQNVYQPGPYTLLLYQQEATQAVWYLDNTAVFSRSVAWAGRAQSDPWGLSNGPWVPFYETVNSQQGGAVFQRGRALQVRGQAVAQNATIENVKIVPKYAELGNLTWPHNDTINNISSPARGIEVRGSLIYQGNNTYQFTAAPNILDPSLTIASYTWDFGDGTVVTGSNATVTHAYAVSNLLTIVKLTVTDNNGANYYGCAPL